VTLKVDYMEIEGRYQEWGIQNVVNGSVLECDSQQQAEFDTMLYPHSQVVSRWVFVTKWVPVAVLPT